MSSRYWKEVRIGDICEVKGGKRLPKGVNLVKEKNSHPYIRIRDMYQHKYIELDEDVEYVDNNTFDKIKRYIVNSGDIIIAIVGNTIGLVSMIGKTMDNASLTENCVKLVNLNSCISNFLYYHLISKKGQNEIRKRIVGTSQPKLPIYNVQDIPISLPPVDEQKAIAATLSCLDDKIELNNRINKTLEEMAQAIFKSWFVDFEPFQDGDFEDSELGRIPKGWRVGTLGEIASVSSGKRPPVKSDISTEETNIPVVGASSIMAYTNNYLQDEKILVTGRVGTHGIIQRFYCKCWPSDNTLVIKSERYEYVYQVLCNLDYTSLNRGSTQPLITQTDLKNSVIVIPPNKVLDDFEEMVSQLMDVWDQNDRQIKTLRDIRDTLLPKLMSGEIRVPIEEVQ